ncbi:MULTISPECIES: CopM family metallochaperone [Microvirga]|uniref:DUF305 domain-containing protein n=2 Tax=Microvirga TaxID=186650 RepID=A0ABW9Z831_9HYPH|nr:DUF305 domain-containing protein [Microvirga arsenatis]NBJ13087.1 DUF305 domain-containing protein [Microvirga arsenatis]NBJ26794.1 DUF305 domain-containing protein [Microvirga arsenatis]
MKSLILIVTAAVAIAGPALAQAQSSSQQHHTTGAPAATAQGQMMHGSGMMQGAGAQAGNQSEATKAYSAAVDKMHAPMAQAIQNADPDIAFVKGMIPHHQSAVDMAKVVLQYGKDEQAKKWATDVIREQEREIGEMRAWLRAKGAE